jgi:AraC family transcriptional regulator
MASVRMTCDHGPRVERAISFILEHLFEPLPLARVSHAAHLSKFHFHRTFAAIAREPVGHFITRKRLEAAALGLAYERDRDVTDIALSSGYSSPSNFTKAFSNYYGCSPSDFRAPRSALPIARGTLLREHGLSLRPDQLYRTPPLSDERGDRASVAAVQQNVRFMEVKDIALCCLPAPLGADHTQIKQTFQRLTGRTRELGLPDPTGERFGLRFEHELLTPLSLRRYHACVRCWSGFVPPPPLLPNRIADGPYAVFTLAANTVDAYRAQYYAAFAHWPGDRSVVNANRWPVERYGPHTTGARLEAEVWIKVRPRR